MNKATTDAYCAKLDRHKELCDVAQSIAVAMAVHQSPAPEGYSGMTLDDVVKTSFDLAEKLLDEGARRKP